MTETTGQGTETHARIPRQHDRRAESPQRTAWAGWVFFAAVMLSLLGTFHVIAGLVAIFDEDYFTVGKNDLVVEVGYNTWGWVHVIGGSSSYSPPSR